MKNNKENFIGKVIELAQKNVLAGKGGPFAAIIVKDNKIISYGYNQVTSKKDPTLHAEIDAIRKASKKLKTFDLSGCEIFASCYPCPMCLSAIYWANIKTVYYSAAKEVATKYGFKDGKIYNELKTKIKSVTFVELKSADFKAPFEEWKNKKDKIKY
jgi:guanine deaminase